MSKSDCCCWGGGGGVKGALQEYAAHSGSPLPAFSQNVGNPRLTLLRWRGACVAPWTQVLPAASALEEVEAWAPGLEPCGPDPLAAGRADSTGRGRRHCCLPATSVGPIRWPGGTC